MGTALFADAAIPQQQASEEWTGADDCARCHAAEHEAWRGSHHDLAMQPVSEMAVLGAFDGSGITRNGATSKFFRRDGGYWVETGGPDGKLREYPVSYVFGAHPLQQYLVEFPGGRLQALDIAWDSRPAASGGQRWFHLRTADAPAGPQDPMHWTGTYYNWNARCAECHSTNLSKAYDPESGTYATTWSEINVACEACHGPGGRHAALAEAGRLHEVPDSGLEVALGSTRAWSFAPGESIARRDSPPDRHEVETCAPCHSRRTSLDHYRHGAGFLNTHLPALLEAGLYHVDGQIREEVYVYGSFAQSRMYQAGVTCSDCHDPHGLELRAPGNAVCAQCHLPGVYDNATHHRHAAGSSGAACVNCHMPATTYMVVDPRRDHSFQVPRPDLSAIAGTPNACNGCHQERSIEWATKALADWGVDPADTGSHRGRVLQLARRGDMAAARDLGDIAMDHDTPPIWRATAAAEAGRFPGQQVHGRTASLLESDDALLRVGAVRATAFLPWPQRLGKLEPYLADPVKAVRVELARVLADVPSEQADKRLAPALETLFDEYLESLAGNADMPEALSQRGDFLTARRLWEPAEGAYRDALASDPEHVPALLNLADLYRVLAREEEARSVLHSAAKVPSGQAAAHHALGLLEMRAGQRDLAFRHLARAAELETDGVRYRYVYAIALHDQGDTAAAIATLKALLRVAPRNAEILVALVNYSRSAGQLPDARRYADELRSLFPDDRAIQRLYDSL